VESRQDQIAIYEKIVGQNLSVRDTEALVRGYHNKGQGDRKSGKSSGKLPDFVREGQKELEQALDTDIKVVSSEKGKGKISISFRNKEDFSRLIKQITGA